MTCMFWSLDGHFLIGKSHCPLTQGDVLQEAIGKHQHTPNKQQLHVSCAFLLGQMRQQQIRPPPPKKKMESNNKKTLPGCRLLFGGFWHKYTQSQSVWHLQIILAFGGIFVPGWLDLKTWEQWQHCCFACVLRCQLFLLQLLIHLRKVVEFDTRGFFWDPWQTNWLQYLYIYHIDKAHDEVKRNHHVVSCVGPSLIAFTSPIKWNHCLLPLQKSPHYPHDRSRIPKYQCLTNYSNWKVDGTVPTYWFIGTLY